MFDLISTRWVPQEADTRDWARRDHSTAWPASAVLLRNTGTGTLHMTYNIKFGIQLLGLIIKNTNK